MGKTLQKIKYEDLNARQQESYNYQKVSAVLAEYGFTTIKLSDDWQGADFIAQHIDGTTFLKVQLKGRLTFAKKYLGKEVYICFGYEGHWYLGPHDQMSDEVHQIHGYRATESWEAGLYSFKSPGIEIMKVLEQYRL